MQGFQSTLDRYTLEAFPIRERQFVNQFLLEIGFADLNDKRTLLIDLSGAVDEQQYVVLATSLTYGFEVLALLVVDQKLSSLHVFLK